MRNGVVDRRPVHGMTTLVLLGELDLSVVPALRGDVIGSAAPLPTSTKDCASTVTTRASSELAPSRRTSVLVAFLHGEGLPPRARVATGGPGQDRLEAAMVVSGREPVARDDGGQQRKDPLGGGDERHHGRGKPDTLR